MTPPPIEPLPSERSRAGLWAWIPTTLGVAVLVGSAIWGGVVAMQGASVPAVVTSAAPLPSGELPPQGQEGEPNPSIAAIEKKAAEPADSVPAALSSSIPGPRVRPAEAKALLPVVDGAPIWGTSDALTTLAVFGDLECPYTRAALRRVLRLSDRVASVDLRVVFYQRPIEAQAFSSAAARMLAAVALREGPDAAFRTIAEFARSDEKPNLPELARWLDSAGVDRDTAALGADPAGLVRVQDDLRLAAELDVRATPTLFVNGRRLQGLKPQNVLERTIADEARATRWLRAQGVTPEKAYTLRVEKNLIGVEGGAADRVCAPVARAPVDGGADALVTVVEFSDFECAHCRRIDPDLRRIVARYPGAVRRVWRSFALPQHSRARRAAAFALGAREAGNDSVFWKLHAALLRDEKPLDDVSLARLAVEVGLPAERLFAAASDPARAGELDEDEALGRDLGVEGTPTLFVNGRRVTGAVPENVLDAVIREELAAARRITGKGKRANELERLLCGEAPSTRE